MHPIDLIDAQLLKIACPENSILMLAGWADPIKQGCIKYNIVDVRPIAMLLAQAGHESEGLTHLAEDLCYLHPERIQAVYGTRRFPTVVSAAPYVRNPEKLANLVYANRMGNGDVNSGDGWTYRGFGPFQITGKNNQRAFGETVGLPVEKVPAFLRSTNGGALSMCWFFASNGLIALSAQPGVQAVTRVINGGLNGLGDRQARFDAVIKEMLRRGA